MTAAADSIMRSAMKLKSPNGVADFVRFDEETIKKDLNNSFSWAECPQPEQPKDDSCESRMLQVRARLKWVEEQSLKDKQDYHEQLRQAKFACREQLRKKYIPLLQQNKNNNEDGAVVETSKIIQYLRDDNSRLRQEMEQYGRLIRQLQLSNEQLEQANAAAQASYDELESHVYGLIAIQAKLNDNCKVFKKHIKSMKEDYVKRSSFHQSELKAGGIYEVCLAKVLANVKSRSREGDLIESVYKTAEEGVLQAAEGREEQLLKVGLALEKRPQSNPFSILEPQPDSSDFESDSSDSDDEN
jgi:hypothetical protein